MRTLRRIVATDFADLPEFRLDRFQEAVLENLYLEFFVEKSRVLITPHFDYFFTGEVEDEERSDIESILLEHKDPLLACRRYVVFNLALYTALLETNSYYLSLNGNLLICRFLPVGKDPDSYVLKLYTISPDELETHYTDKIYLGRDRVSMKALRRPHFGLPTLRDAALDQMVKLKERLARWVPEGQSEVFERRLAEDLEDSLTNLSTATDTFLEDFPDTLFTENLDADTLLAANQEIRDVKHFLIEMKDTLRDMESLLLDEGHAKAARYVTKFKKDVSNDINFLLVKVNGRISNVVNRIDALSDFG